MKYLFSVLLGLSLVFIQDGEARSQPINFSKSYSQLFQTENLNEAIWLSQNLSFALGQTVKVVPFDNNFQLQTTVVMTQQEPTPPDDDDKDDDDDKGGWKKTKAFFGPEFGYPTGLGLRAGIELLKGVLSVSFDGGIFTTIAGVGTVVNVTPLAVKGYKFLYINGKLYGFQATDIENSKEDQVRSAYMAGIGVGVRFSRKLFSPYVEVGRGKYFRQHHSGKQSSQWDWYTMIGFTTTWF